MNTSGKVVMTVGIASSALFAAWLLTGTRRIKTRKFVARKAITFKDAIKQRKAVSPEEQEICYI